MCPEGPKGRAGARGGEEEHVCNAELFFRPHLLQGPGALSWFSLGIICQEKNLSAALACLAQQLSLENEGFGWMTPAKVRPNSK